MKHTNKFLGGAVLLAGLNLAIMTGCVGGGGYVEAGGPGYYGDGPWIDNNVVVYGHAGWYGNHHDGAYVHPSNHPAARASVNVNVNAHVDHH
jgi:hypothetical protein